MRNEDLQEHLERVPFQPFRVHLSNGAFFDISHPQMAHVTRATLHVALPVEGDRQRFVVITLVRIVWLEVSLPVP
jgi:hypothetical protein